jgi:alanyl-tRNA synthetase
MTERLYYNDSYTMDFTARVTDRIEHDQKFAVVLDQTYFYPTGGGQPNDLGMINGIEVIDVFSREEAVYHILTSPLNANEVACQVDFTRRFDHMQQHTAQHILTQAFVQTANANTVSFHLSGDTVTIDLDTAGITSATVIRVEDLTNQIVFENRPVTARLIDPKSVTDAGVRMRKMPDQIHTDGLRVIDIGEFDVTACGGTHVAHTGEIGIIKVVKLEKRGDKTRVDFRAGGRALSDYRAKNSVANRLTVELTCAFEDTPEAVTRIKDDLQTAQRALKAATNQLLSYEAAKLIAENPPHNGIRMIKMAFENRDVNEVRMLASSLIENTETIALLGTSGEKAQIFLARSADLSYNMNDYLKPVLEVIGARGGGQPGFAQGGGVKTTLEQIKAALDFAQQMIMG